MAPPPFTLQRWGSLDIYLFKICPKSDTDWYQDFIRPNFTLFDVQHNEATAIAQFIKFRRCLPALGDGGCMGMEDKKCQKLNKHIVK